MVLNNTFTPIFLVGDEDNGNTLSENNVTAKIYYIPNSAYSDFEITVHGGKYIPGVKIKSDSFNHLKPVDINSWLVYTGMVLRASAAVSALPAKLGLNGVLQSWLKFELEDNYLYFDACNTEADYMNGFVNTLADAIYWTVPAPVIFESFDNFRGEALKEFLEPEDNSHADFDEG